MASKNLGAVIQRAISDGAFRRQLQSDPAAALRGFNLSPDEIAAVRSGDSSKLMSLGVDQRMSKAFTLGGAGTQATRAAMSGDVSGSTSNALVGDNTSGAREGIVGDPTSGARAATTTTQGDSYRAINDPDNTGGTRETVSAGQQDSYRAVNDPDNAGGTRSGSSAVEDTNSPEFAAAHGSDSDTLASRMQDANADLSLPGSDVQHDPGFVDTHSAFIPSDSADVQRELQDSHGDAIGNTGNTGVDS